MTEVPARCSIHDRDIDWNLALRLVVKLDGQEQQRVIAYDAEAGWVDRYQVDAQGNIVIDRVRDVAAVERVTGVVAVDLLPEGGGSKV